MNYEKRALELAHKEFGSDVKIIRHLVDEKFELISLATSKLETYGDGLSYPVYCVNKLKNKEILSAGILGVLEDEDFAELVPNKMIVL